MTFIVTLRDKSQQRLDDDDADSLKSALANASGSIMVELGSTMVRSSEIVTIKREQRTEADTPRGEFKELPADRCRGEYSIQKAIHEIALNDHPGEWAKLVQNTKWREEIRYQLRTTGAKWCDYRAGECACD